MKRFHFRLERVLKLKQQRERQAELRQQQARLMLENAKANVAVLTDRLIQNAAALEAQIGNLVQPDSWIAGYQYLAQIGQALELAEVKARRAGEGVREADALRARIAIEVEALLYLRRR